MINKISQITFSSLFVVMIVLFSAYFVSAQNTQNLKVEPEVKQYVEEKGKKAKVPADIANIARGDLNGDGKEDVVIQYYIQIGYPGNLTDTYLTAFLNKQGKMKFAAETDDVKVVPAKIENGVLFCDKYGDGSKKFEKIGTVKFKLAKSRLIEIKDKK